MCVCVYVCVCVCVCMCVCVCVYVCASFLELLCGERVNESEGADICVRACVCFMCMYVCVCFCVRVFQSCCLLRDITGWRRVIGCLIFIGHFRKRTLQLVANLREMIYEIRHPMGLCHPVPSRVQTHTHTHTQTRT